MRRTLWNRREFVGAATAAASLSMATPSFAVGPTQKPAPPPKSQGDSPEVISGGLQPLLESNLARPMRYHSAAGAFVIRNGKECFNRPLYGPNIPFRVDGGDLPEFSLYLPGHGGNLRLGFSATGGSKWLSQADLLVTRYSAGRLLYEVRDSLLGSNAVLHVEALVEGAGLWVEVRPEGLHRTAALTWVFGGVSGRKGRRNGDIGCEVQPVSKFFQVRPSECQGNRWTIHEHEADVQSEAIHLHLTAPSGAKLRIFDAEQWDAGWDRIWSSTAATTTPSRPALAGQLPFAETPLRLRVDVLAGAVLPIAPATGPDADRFRARKAELTETANALSWITPDALLDGIAPALGIASDAIWDEAEGCVMHGAVAWRNPLAGWRGPYVLDITGRHDRMQRHLRHWIARQNVTPVENGSDGEPGPNGFTSIVPATGAPDKGSANSRSEGLLHSNGDLSHNHYDMNLVFFDALLRHLRWTGDLAFARETWPALVRHAAWERRLFRREYGSAAHSQPLYEAYAAIWASDNLQYSGGGAAHSSAYNLFLNRRMAEIADILSESSAAYRAEANAIDNAMRQLLWMPGRGAFAESKDWLGDRGLAEDPALWTVYHTIDSEVTTRKEAWQMVTERLHAIRKVPIVGADVPPGGWQMACSDWMPYVWSLTLLVLAENLHTALALYQAGRSQEAFGLLYGSLIDAGYRGLCPGNFPMSLQLDPHRQESQRDFGDPIGCASRALVEGLWGVRPDLLTGHLDLRPQLPRSWTHGKLRHPELNLTYRRDGSDERWQIHSLLPKPAALRLEIPAWTVELPQVLIDGHAANATFVPEAVGSPSLLVQAPAAPSWTVDVRWKGAQPLPIPTEPLRCKAGEKVPWPATVANATIDDPQGCLEDGHAKSTGSHTVFASVHHGDCHYWLPLRLEIAPTIAPRICSTTPQPTERFELVPIDSLLTGHLTQILSRSYTEPRPDLCSLNLPEGLLGGWANFDVKAEIDDAGLRAANGELHLTNGLSFRTPAAPNAPNCRFLSRWSFDQPTLQVPLTGQARAVYVLLACTTFPQATRSVHGVARIKYSGQASPTAFELRTPQDWWPVEQDYLLDDYLFRMEPVGAPQQPLPIRVDLQTGRTRILDRNTATGKVSRIRGGSATVLRLELDPLQSLEHLELDCTRNGVVMGVLAVTLGR